MNISLFLFIFSASTLIFAHTAEYAFGILPCIMCIYQRIPFFIVLFVSFLSLFIKNKVRVLLVAFCGVTLLVGAGIAFYHVGIEQGKFKLSSGCEGHEKVPETLEELMAQTIGKPHIPCDKVQFTFLGISMAGWNFLFSSSIGFITLVIAFRIFKDIRAAKRGRDYKKE